jgi:predicted TIM-barrel fold metal-dependent hydrolase
MLKFEKRVRKILEGSIDVHIHSAPDIFPRIMDDIDIALSAKREGMRAVLIKSHVSMTADRAAIASKQADFPVFGGIVLNLSVGGLNIHAVDASLELGAKKVWLPTFHASHFIAQKSHSPTLAGAVNADIKGIYLLNDEGNLREELIPIFEKIAEHDVALGTGHISFEESKAVVRKAAEMGIKKIVVTHPMCSFINHTVENMRELLDSGAMFLEHVFNDVTGQVTYPITQKKIAETIRAIGARYTVMSTDTGQLLNPIPAQAMGMFIKDMLDLGISEEDVEMMVCENPARVLGL